MYQLLKQIATTGIMTERAAAAGRGAARGRAAAARGDPRTSAGRSRSATSTPAPATAASSRSTRCNNPYYNLEGLGIKFVASPRHADLLLVTGPVSRNMEAGAQAHLRRDARAQAGGRDRRLRLHRRHLRRELRQLRARLQRDPGGRGRARLPADADRDHAGHTHRDPRAQPAFRRLSRCGVLRIAAAFRYKRAVRSRRRKGS